MKYDKSEIKQIVKDSIKEALYSVKPKTDEGMFPKDFKRHSLGTCMSAAALATSYFLAKGIKNFNIVEGFVSMYPDQEEEDWSAHTWIEFDDGRKFDPTKKQWERCGFKVSKTKYEKVTKTFTPEQYIKLCRIQGDIDEVTQKDIKPNINISPTNTRYDDQENLKFDRLTLDNLKALRSKAGRSWRYGVKHHDTNITSLAMNAYKRYNDEIKKRLLYINRPVNEIRLEPPVDNEPVMENMTYDELLQLTAKTPRSPEDDTNRIDRSKTVNVRSLPVSVEEDNEQWNFRYKSSRVSSVTDETFEGHITFLKGEVGRNDDATMLECKVDCGCPDYMYKFAYNNYAKGAGDIGPGSENNAINRRPKPAYDIGEGLCKHLSALSKYLTTKLKATKTQNIFEAVNEIAKQGPFNITYQD